MSYGSQVLIQCTDLQDKLSEVWGKTSMGVSDPIPFLEYIVSDANRNMIDDMVTFGNGKTRNVQLTFFQRLLEDTVVAASERGCAATEKYGNCDEVYSIDTTDLLKSGELINAADLARFCESNPMYIAERLAHHLNVIDRAVATKIAGQASALLGGWSADAVQYYSITGDVLEVATKDGSGNYSIGAWEQINNAARMSGYEGLVGFGSAGLAEYMRLSQSGCCANQGLDVVDIYNQWGYAFAYDRRLADALGSIANNSLIMEPGALQLIDYTETPWKDGVMDFSPGYIGEQITTPAGVAVDLYIKDDCGKLSINVFANVKLVGLPDDLFGTGDNFDGVQFAAAVNVNNS